MMNVQPLAPAQRRGNKTFRRIYQLRLQSPGADADIRHLRELLKILLRTYGWRCLRIEEVRR